MEFKCAKNFFIDYQNIFEEFDPFHKDSSIFFVPKKNKTLQVPIMHPFYLRGELTQYSLSDERNDIKGLSETKVYILISQDD